ncbi:4717_t:CDS:2, partial [Racocetra fulgida]
SSHNIVDSKKLKSETQIPKGRQTTLSVLIRLNILYKGDKLKEINRAVIEWILLDNEPLSASRKKGFRRMMQKLIQINYALQKICSYTKKIRKLVHFFDSPKQQERLEKAQMKVIERDNLPLPSLVNTEFYFEEKEAGEINDGDTDSELSNINPTSKPLHPNLTLNEDDFDKEYCSDSSDSESKEVQVVKTCDIQSIIAQKYWGEPKNTDLLATLLDPRLKKMRALSNYFKNEAISACCEKLDNIIIDVTPIQSTASSGITSANRYFASIFDDKDDDNLLNDNELDKYLDTDKVPIAPPGAQPLV